MMRNITETEQVKHLIYRQMIQKYQKMLDSDPTERREIEVLHGLPEGGLESWANKKIEEARAKIRELESGSESGTLGGHCGDVG